MLQAVASAEHPHQRPRMDKWAFHCLWAARHTRWEPRRLACWSGVKHNLVPPRCRLVTNEPLKREPLPRILEALLKAWGTDQTLPHPLPIPSLPSLPPRWPCITSSERFPSLVHFLGRFPAPPPLRLSASPSACPSASNNY